MKKIIIVISILCVIGIVCSLVFLYQPKQEFTNGVIVDGSVTNTQNSKVVLHFSTWQNQTDLSSIIRKTRATSQFLFFDEKGNLDNHFSVNREILCNPIVKTNDTICFGYSDFCLKSNGKSLNFVDDATNLNLSSMTMFGPQTSGYIEAHDSAYYLLNLGSNAISGQYTTILRFVTQDSSYDIVIPESVYYIAYDKNDDKFIYRLSDDVGVFSYGYITFDENKLEYVLNQTKYKIDKEIINNKYGYFSQGYGILFEENYAYELMICEINDTIMQECHLTLEDIEKNKKAGILMLCKYDLLKQTVSCEYLSKSVIYGDSSYGFVLSGTQSMPLTIDENKLYLFTRNNKMYVYDTKNGIKVYDFIFDFSDTISSSNPFDKSSIAGPTLGDGSPIIIDNGNIYTGHIYKSGAIKIHKYNFEKEIFELFWESSNSVVSELEKNSLEFISFEIIK